MGNLQNKSSTSSTDESKVDRGINMLQPEGRDDAEPEQHQYYGNPSDHDDKQNTARRSNTALIPDADSDTSGLKSVDLRREINNAGDMCDNCHRIHKMAAEKAVDPRLLTLLEFFRQLYVRRQEVFKTSFPDLHEKFDEMFKKNGAKLSQVKSGRKKAQPILQRSMSVGSLRAREISGDDLKVERFKVRIINVGGDTNQSGKGGQDGKGGGAK